MTAIAPTADFIRVIDDSRRWAHVEHRSDDIVISTPPKSGTTWMQGIVSSLLWPAGDAPGALGDRSPWVDVRLRPVDVLVGALEAQTHRRFIKTHSPSDSIPFDSRVKYLTVYRSAADALVSWGNHRAAMRPELIELFNSLAAVDGLDPLALRFDGDYDTLIDEWSRCCSPAVHLAPWWPRRHEPNVLMLHYADMFADLETTMRQIADFLEIDVVDELWEQTVDRCRLDSMRQGLQDEGWIAKVFEGGADAFFHRGGNGRGRELLTAAQLERCRAHCAELLPAEAVDFLENGWLEPA